MPDYIVVTTKLEEKQQHVLNDYFVKNEVVIDFLAFTPDKKREKILQRADILLTLNPHNDLKKTEFKLLDRVRFMQLISAGADHIPYEDIPEHITIASNTGAYAKPIAEHVAAMALALAKRLREEHQNMKKGEFNQFNRNIFIKNSIVGILGFGGIGQATADLFRAFGSRIFAMNTSGESDISTNFIGTSKDLKYILSSSDIIVLSLPLNNQTRELIGEAQLKWMKPDAILINVARGEIVNQRALYKHLKTHPDFKAGLESWWVEPVRHGSFELDYPLLDLPNVLASPHNSSMVPGIMEHGIVEAMDNIKRYLNKKPFKGKINRENFV